MAEVLISGASMAGLSAAHWFARVGAHVTIAERASGLRRGGAPIDVRGDALGVAERMGILDEVGRQRVPTRDGPGRVLDETGAHVANIDLTWFANDSDDDIEISRDRLNDILLSVVPSGVDLRFETSAESIVDGDDGAEVTLSDGSSATYDLVVGADGLHSNTRALVFGPESDYLKHLGVYVSLLNLDPERRWDPGTLTMPGLSVFVRDTGDGPLAYVMARSPQLAYDYRDAEAQRRIVGDFLAGLDAWEVPALREAFLDPSTDGFYFDSVSQIHMPHWTKGHVAVIGDAGHCAALLSGMGTSLAMIAAELLATEWAAADGDLDAATPTYEAKLRPYVDGAQASVSEGAKMMVPATQADLDERNQLLRDLEAKVAPTIYLGVSAAAQKE